MSKELTKRDSKINARLSKPIEEVQVLRSFATKNYNQFKIFKGNRKVSETALKVLIGRIQAHNALNQYPIVITSDGYIKDGQHRLEAARRLKLTVYYTVVDEKASVESIMAVNGIRNAHTVNDKIYMNIEKQGACESMLTIKKTFDKFEGFFSLVQIGEVLTTGYSSGSFIKCLDSGAKVTLSNFHNGMKVLNALYNSNMKRKWTDTKGVCKGTVLYALSKITAINDVDPLVVLHRVEMNSILWEAPTDRKNAVEAILKCFNYNQKKNKLVAKKQQFPYSLN